MSFSNPQYFRKQILKPSIFQATNLQGLNSSGNKLTSSPNPQYFWQQIDQLFKSTIFLATDWPYLQILDISGNKLTSSAGNRVARMASQLFDAHRRRREEPGETYNSDIAFNLVTGKMKMKTTDISYHLFFYSNLMLFLADNWQFLLKGQSLTRKPTRRRSGLKICQNCRRGGVSEGAWIVFDPGAKSNWTRHRSSGRSEDLAGKPLNFLVWIYSSVENILEKQFRSWVENFPVEEGELSSWGNSFNIH